MHTVETTSILLADPQPVCREAVRKILSRDPALRVVAEAADGRRAIGLALKLDVDLVVCETEMPRLSGLEVARRLAARGSAPRTLLVTARSSPALVAQAFRGGAAGFLLKSEPPAELIAAIGSLRRGIPYVSPRAACHLIAAAIQDGKPDNGGLGELTGREREVLQLLAEGRSCREIARELSISICTAESHRRSVMIKLRIRKVSRLVRFAVREGLIDH